MFKSTMQFCSHNNVFSGNHKRNLFLYDMHCNIANDIIHGDSFTISICNVLQEVQYIVHNVRNEFKPIKTLTVNIYCIRVDYEIPNLFVGCYSQMPMFSASFVHHYCRPHHSLNDYLLMIL